MEPGGGVGAGRGGGSQPHLGHVPVLPMAQGAPRAVLLCQTSRITAETTRKTPHQACVNWAAEQWKAPTPSCQSTWAKQELHLRDPGPTLGSSKSPLVALSSANRILWYLMGRGSGENLAAMKGQEGYPVSLGKRSSGELTKGILSCSSQSRAKGCTGD